MVEKAVFLRLTQNEAVSALVSSRIYKDSIPKNEALPAITYERFSTDHDHHHGGADGLVFVRLRLTCFAALEADAEAVADAVRKTLNGKTWTLDGIAVRGCFLDDESHDSELIERGGETVAHSVAHEYELSYLEEL